MLQDPETTHESRDQEDASDNESDCDANKDTLATPIVVKKHHC